MIPAANSPEACRFGVVILGAGLSSRMGSPKLLLPWAGTSVVNYSIQQWRGVGAAQVAIVCSPIDREVRTELAKIKFDTHDVIENPEPIRGMFSSIQCAATWHGWSKTLTHWVVALGDQPHLRTETLQHVVQFAFSNRAHVCQPSHAGHRRHPVVMPKAEFRRLGNSTAISLREFLQKCEVRQIELDDPGLVLDIDTPEDYQRAKRLMLERGKTV